MSDFYKKRSDDEDDTGPIGKRKPRPEPKPERQGYVGRFPALPDGRAALGFTTLSHSNLKTWSQIDRAEGHNTRKIAAPNVRDGAPPPIELLEWSSGSYVDRAKRVMKEHGASTKVRSNVNAIATEDVYGASPEYWNRNGDWKLKPAAEIIADPVIQAALALARRKHGRRLISLSLHLDEESPHLHVVAVPLVEREHTLRGPKPKHCSLDANGKPIDPRPKVLKWSLDASSLRWGGALERNHDEWAAECEPFGLVRGSKGSDMTEEARRARRNRQTGRSSMAEKEARERRESLADEAEAARELAKKLVEEAEAKRAETEALRADVERLKAVLEEREREVMQLSTDAIADRAAAATERKKVAEAKSSVEIREAALATAVSENAAQVKTLGQQLELLGKLLDPDCPLKIKVVDGNLILPGCTPEQRQLLGTLPGALVVPTDRLIRQTAMFSRDMADLKSAREQLERDRQELEMKWDVYEQASDPIIKTAKLAIEFKNAWAAVPEIARSPQITSALRAADALSIADLPLGYALPGRGGRGI
jgi:hypothetical protein